MTLPSGALVQTRPAVWIKVIDQGDFQTVSRINMDWVQLIEVPVEDGKGIIFSMFNGNVTTAVCTPELRKFVADYARPGAIRVGRFAF